MTGPDLLEFLHARRGAMLESLTALVEHESPSRDKAALDGLANLLVERFQRVGGSVERLANGAGGDHLIIRFAGGGESKTPGLVLGHFDTVWPVGTLARLPVRTEGDRVFGPGIFDMKASLVLAEFAMLTLREHGVRPPRPWTFVFTSDEEIGSPISRPFIEEIARRSAVALVLEPPLAGGRLKTARKGVGGFTVTVIGRAAHAGIEPEKGVSAIEELAHQVLRIQKLSAPHAGTTVNVGLIQGGSAANTVAAEAWAKVDVRAASMEEAARVESALRGLEAVHPEARVLVEGGINRPPMVRTAAIAALFEQARELGRGLGLELTEGSTGGGSDGNFTAAIGVPTLDGLGTPGAGAHAENEHILASTLPERAALLARLLLGLRFPELD